MKQLQTSIVIALLAAACGLYLGRATAPTPAPRIVTAHAPAPPALEPAPPEPVACLEAAHELSGRLVSCQEELAATAQRADACEGWGSR